MEEALRQNYRNNSGFASAYPQPQRTPWKDFGNNVWDAVKYDPDPNTTWLERSGSNLMGDFNANLTGVDAQGNRVPNTVRALGMLMPGGGGFGGKAGAAGLGMFAGVRAKTANKLALDLAKKMEADGASRDEIWKATGEQFGQPWMNDTKGGGWKFEIDDSASRIAPKAEVSFGQLENVGAYTPESRLGDNIWHQGLYDGYPKTSEISTSLAKANYPSGSFHSTTMNEKPFRSKIQADGADLESIKSTLLHEGQHGVQEAEGFARGGSMKDLKDPSTTEWFQDRLDDGVFQIEQAVKYGDKSAEVYNPATGKNIIIEGKDYKEYVDYASQKGVAADLHYRHLAGEAEARNVQTRMDYPMQQRIDEAPWTTLDVPENELIFRGNGNNKSMINALQGKDRNP